MSTELTPNYDTRVAGVPYLRAPRIELDYPEPGSGAMPRAVIKQVWAAKMADGRVFQLQGAREIQATLDLSDQTLLPLVDVDSGLPLPPEFAGQLGALVASGHVTLEAVMLFLLAAVRAQQVPANAPPEQAP